MRTNYVLIDFENVQPDSLEVLHQDHFKVIVFVGANQSKLSFETVSALQRMGSKAEYVKITGNGPNALDFHIAYYIGRLSATNDTGYFHIISKDAGFDPLIQHLKEKKIAADRLSCVSEIPIIKTVPPIPPLVQTVPSNPPIIKTANTKTPQELLQSFVAKLKQPKATRPRTVKTMSSAINALFQKQLSDTDVADIIAAMRAKKFITVADGKITYNF